MKVRTLKHRRSLRTRRKYSSAADHLKQYFDLMHQHRDAIARGWTVLTEDLSRVLIGYPTAVEGMTVDNTVLFKGEIGFIDDGIHIRDGV